MFGCWYFILCKEEVRNRRAQSPVLRTAALPPLHHCSNRRQEFVGGQDLPTSYRAKSKLFSQHLRPAVIQTSAWLVDLFSSPQILILLFGYLSRPPHTHYPFLLSFPLPKILISSPPSFPALSKSLWGGALLEHPSILVYHVSDSWGCGGWWRWMICIELPYARHCAECFLLDYLINLHNHPVW